MPVAGGGRFPRAEPPPIPCDPDLLLPLSPVCRPTSPRRSRLSVPLFCSVEVGGERDRGGRDDMECSRSSRPWVVVVDDRPSAAPDADGRLVLFGHRTRQSRPTPFISDRHLLAVRPSTTRAAPGREWLLLVRSANPRRSSCIDGVAGGTIAAPRMAAATESLPLEAPSPGVRCWRLLMAARGLR